MSPPSSTSLPLLRSFMSHSSRASLGTYEDFYKAHRMLSVVLCYFTATFFSPAQSQRSCSPTSHRSMSQMKVTSTFHQLSLQPSAVKSWLTRACTTPPPRLMALVQAAPVWLEHTWMMSRPGPMGPAALIVLKLTAGDLLMYELVKGERTRREGPEAGLTCCKGGFVGWQWEESPKESRKKVVGHWERVILVSLWHQVKLTFWWTPERRPLLASEVVDNEFNKAFVTLLPECTAAVSPHQEGCPPSAATTDFMLILFLLNVEAFQLILTFFVIPASCICWLGLYEEVRRWFEKTTYLSFFW